jgi:signal transduction histidine kinase
LTNVYKYAKADEIKIQLGTSATELYLVIQDNGKGFNLEQNTSGFGIQGMRERTLALGGQFEIDSAPAAGCRITAYFPCQSFR